jgi:hypothetical protein
MARNWDVQVGRFWIIPEGVGTSRLASARRTRDLSRGAAPRWATYSDGRGERSQGHTFQLTYAIVPEAGLLVEVA